jgi:hypothetical protein
VFLRVVQQFTKISSGWELVAHSRNYNEHRSAGNCSNVWKRRNIGNACTHDNYKTMVTLLTNVSINEFSSSLKHLLFLSDFNQTWNMSTNFSCMSQYYFSCKSQYYFSCRSQYYFSRQSCRLEPTCYMRTDLRTQT